MILDEKGRPLRRPLGFVERNPVPDVGTIGATSGTQPSKPMPVRWQNYSERGADRDVTSEEGPER